VLWDSRELSTNQQYLNNQPNSDLAFYGRLLSVAWAKSMLCFANVILFIYFLWPPYAPALVNGGSRNFYTWWTLSVNREVTTWIFSWSSLNYRDGPKSDEIRHIFRPRPQTFCSRGRTRQNIVFLIKKLVKHRWLLYTCARFGELWPTNPWDPRVILLFLITNDIGE